MKQRKTDRTRVLLKATLLTREGPREVRIRDLSSLGAQISADDALFESADVIFSRGPIFAAATVAWVNGDKAGLQFYRPLSVFELGASS